jgi:hypothetical protein
MRSPQTFASVLLVMILAITAQGAALNLPPDDAFGTPPPTYVRHWTRLSIVSEVNAPFPIIWVSPQSFSSSMFEELIRLSPEEYSSFVSVVRHVPNCVHTLPAHPEWGTMMLSTYSAGSERRCFITRIRACRFLAATASIPGIHWTPLKMRPLQKLAMSIKCHT